MSTSKPCWNPEKMKADKERKPAFSPLFTSIAFWVLLAILLAALVAAVLLKLLGWSFSFPAQGGAAGDNTPDLYKFIQSVLTIVAGIGAVAYLVIKYREQSDAESSKVDQQLLDAVNQLGSDSPQVRIAGVYALAEIADTLQGTYKQRVVDILCGYLRVDRSESDLVRGGSTFQDPIGKITEEGLSEKPHTRIFKDGPVESAILSIIVDRVGRQVSDSNSWSACTFNLNGAVLRENVVLEDAVFSSDFLSRDVRFLGYVSFARSEFCGNASFSGAHFHRKLNLGRARFLKALKIYYAHFCEGVDLTGLEVDGKLELVGVTFCKEVLFQEMNVGSRSDLAGCTFRRSAHFAGAQFSKGTSFRSLTFRDRVNFQGARFGFGSFFQDSEFRKGLYMGGIEAETGFRFSENVIFEKASFSDATFGESARFEMDEFEDEVDFSGAIFGDGASFEGTRYGRGSLLTPIQQEWLRREIAEEQQDV